MERSVVNRASSSSKRPHPPLLFGGVEGSGEDRDSELLCPVCLNLMTEPYVAVPCGHSFCHGCIRKSLELSPKCPQCASPLGGHTPSVFPNVALQSLLVKRNRLQTSPESSLLRDFEALLDRQRDLSPAELDRLQELLSSRQAALESERRSGEVQLLREFLSELKQKKTQELVKVESELERVDEDLKSVSIEDCNVNLGKKRVRMAQHFADLESKYWSLRMGKSSGKPDGELGEFQSDLMQLTRFSELRPLATLSYGTDLLNAAHIVSSIEFDRDADYFAIAGVTKRIKVYEYGTVIRDLVDMHYPVVEMVIL